MFHETTYNFDGLGDCTSDVNAMNAQGHVFPNATVTYNATVKPTVLPGVGIINLVQWVSNFINDRRGNINTSVANRGYRNVSTTVSNATSIGGVTQGTVTIRASVPVDQGHFNDVKSNFDGAVSEAGLSVVSSTISLSNPPASQVCGGGGGGSTNPTGSVNNNQNPGAPDSTPQFLKDLAASLGMSVPIALAVLGVGAMFLLKR
jgi:hypothetical protein